MIQCTIRTCLYGRIQNMDPGTVYNQNMFVRTYTKHGPGSTGVVHRPGSMFCIRPVCTKKDELIQDFDVIKKRIFV